MSHTHIVGQTHLLEKLNSYTLQTLPKTLMFLGEEGCGKHCITEYLANKFGFDLIKIEESITTDDLIEFNQKTVSTLYLIDLTRFTEKQQNQFLKFIEEPASSVYIVLTANSEIGVLPTILNRCVKFTFEPYTVEQLREFLFLAWVENDLFYKICRTPGKLVNVNDKIFSDLCALCTTIITKIQVASYANTLSIATKINYKDTYDKFDFNLFFDTLEYLALENYKETNQELSFKIYLITNQFKQKLLNKTVAKENFMLNFLTQLWKETR